MTTWICEKCEQASDSWHLCQCGGTKAPACERIGCNKLGSKSIYGPGYLASVCEEHYEAASAQDKLDADRFRYAE